MVSSVADLLFNRLIDAFPPDSDYRHQDYARDPMPGLIVTHLDRSMEVRLESAAQLRDEWFDADDREVRKAARSYKEVLSRHQRIPASLWEDVLENACGHTLTFLVHPARALPDLIFRDRSEDVSRDEIFAVLELFPAYPYFREVIDAYFERKGVERIDRARFESLLRRIDRQMTADYDADDWIQLLQPLVGVIKDVPEFSGGIPVDLLGAFFVEKGAEEVIGRLDTKFTSIGRRFVKESELGEIFQPLRDESESEEPLTATVGQMVESAQSAHGEGPLPLWKQFEKGVQVTSKQPSSYSSKGETAYSSTGETATNEPAASGDQPLWKRFRPEGGVGAPVRDENKQVPAGRERVGTDSGDDDLSALERSVLGERGRRNREVFLSHLFGGSKEDYEATLRQLQRASSWSEASQIIAREVFLKHQVNIYSSPAVAFTDAAEAQYGS